MLLCGNTNKYLPTYFDKLGDATLLQDFPPYHLQMLHRIGLSQ